MPNPPVPTKLRIVRGNPGKRKIAKNEPQPAAVVDTRPPKGLSDVARATWLELAPKMAKIGLFTEVDVLSLTEVCELAADVKHLRQDIAENGWVQYEESPVDEKVETELGDATISFAQTRKGRELARPSVPAYNAALRMYRGFLNDHGLSPRARVGLDIELPVPEKERKTGLAEFAAQRGK